MTVMMPDATEVESRLTDIHGLLTATKWERAAIVYACTTNDGPGGHNPINEENTSFPIPIARFADLNIAGLKDRKQVAKYRKAWADAVAAGYAQEAVLGQPVELPDWAWGEPFPEPDDDTDDDDSPEKGSDAWVARKLQDALETYVKARRQVMSVVECNTHFDDCLDTLKIMNKHTNELIEHLEGRI